MPATSRIMQNLKALQNGPHFNKQTGEDEYSDSEFSQLYKNALWHDNVMRSAFLHNLDRLLTSRGFNVQRRSMFMPEAARGCVRSLVGLFASGFARSFVASFTGGRRRRNRDAHHDE